MFFFLEFGVSSPKTYESGVRGSAVVVIMLWTTLTCSCEPISPKGLLFTKVWNPTQLWCFSEKSVVLLQVFLSRSIQICFVLFCFLNENLFHLFIFLRVFNVLLWGMSYQISDHQGSILAPPESQTLLCGNWFLMIYLLICRKFSMHLNWCYKSKRYK